jgi:holo-[acyl-carrier protein] synthase
VASFKSELVVIISIGIDIIEVYRISAVLKRTPRFKERVFTPHEQAYCDERGALIAPKHYAARFAAKEAALKALRTGWSAGIAWQDVEVSSEKNGAPLINFYNRAKEIYILTGATVAHISLSHTNEHAIATVILEK